MSQSVMTQKWIEPGRPSRPGQTTRWKAGCAERRTSGLARGIGKTTRCKPGYGVPIPTQLQTVSLKCSIENRAIFDMYLVRTVPEVS